MKPYNKMLDQIDALLENAFLEGNSMTITNLPYEASEYSLLEIVAQKISETLNLCLVSLDENEAIVKNILKILTDFIPILKNDLEQSLVIAECMLRISAEEIVPVNILKCAVYNLNLMLGENEPVLNWLKNEESLEGYILILGRRLPFVGDFECQSYIFETLCHTIYDNEDKHKWIHSWFTDDEKTKSMFLNWNLQHFEVESRKILNQINRREPNPRTYAYAATAVYFGNVQLKKLNSLEFWIDFNYDSKSISFFCKDFENEDEDISESWETVVISSDNIESYSVQKKEDIKSIELDIILNCPCRDLLVSQVPLFETNLVRMLFWIYVDISSHLKVIFGDPETLANDHVICNQKSQGSPKPRKVSLSVNTFGIRDQDDVVAGMTRKISASDVVEIHAQDYCEKSVKRFSDSAELIKLFDDNDKKETSHKIEETFPENSFPERGQLNDLEVKTFKDGTSENDQHLSDKDTESRKPIRKKLKKGNDVSDKRKSTNSILKRKPNNVEDSGFFDEVPAKKQRKSAIKAREMNKTMLEEKESSGSTEGYIGKLNYANLSDSENKEVFRTPPTKPVKKRRLKSVFLTDTETGSSNVSWIGGKKSCLFETPPKRFSRRIKNKQTTKKASPLKKEKKRAFKSTAVNFKMKQDSNFPVKGFEIKAKSGLSDLENYELVVEKKKDNRKSSHKSFTFENVSKAINIAMEEILNKQNFDNVSNASNKESNIYENIPEFHYNGELLTDDVVLNKDHIANKKPTNISLNNFKSHIANESSTFKIKQSSSEERHSESEKSLFEVKDNLSNSKLQQKIVSNDLPLSSVKKRRRTNLSKPKEKVKRSRNNINNTQRVSLDVAAHVNDFHDPLLIVPDKNSQSIPSAFVTQFLESPDTSEKEKNSFSSGSEKTTENHHHSTHLSPNVGILTEQSLSSLENDEAIGKDLHIQRFLEGCLTTCDDSSGKLKAKSEKKFQKFSSLENHSDSGLQEECFEKNMEEDNYGMITKINGKKPSMQLSILHVLGTEMNNMTHKLLKTLQKHFFDFNSKVIASREKILSTANALISNENDWSHKDLKNIAKTYKESRLQAEKRLKKILLVGQEYFEAEKMLDHKMKRLHKKALKKYAARIKLAGTYAVEALEDRATAKTEVLLKSILKKIENL